MPDIPGFPRKTTTNWDNFNTYMPSNKIPAIVAALAQLEAQYPDALSIEIQALHASSSGLYIEIKVTKPEDEEAYQKRFSKIQEKLSSAGINEDFMQKAIAKVNIALGKLEGE